MNKKHNTVAITGLRKSKLRWNYNTYCKNEEKLINSLVSVIEPLILNDKTNFLCGMATGADTIFAKAVLILKEKYSDITLEAIIPFGNFNKDFTTIELEDYNYIIENSNVVRVLSEEFDREAYKARNEYLVKNSSIVIAVTDDINKVRSGTTQTINMARKDELDIIFVNPFKDKNDEINIHNYFAYEQMADIFEY